MNTLNIIVFWITVILWHELGHFMTYITFGYKPNIKLKWYGITIGENQVYSFKVIHHFIAAYIGILLGLIPFLFIIIINIF